jgi:hypothetical protein
MSQPPFPGPYGAPQQGGPGAQPQWPYAPPGAMPQVGYWKNPLAGARRAAVAVFIVGLLMASCSGLCLGVSFTGVLEQGMQDQPNAAAQLKDAGLTIHEFKVIVAVFSGIICFGGLLLMGMGLLIWRGNLVAAVISLVMTVLLALCFLLCAGVQLVGNEPVAALFVGVVPFLIYLTVSVMLFFGIKSINHAKGFNTQLQMQAWQYQQQQYYNHAIGSGYQDQQQPPPPPAAQ